MASLASPENWASMNMDNNGVGVSSYSNMMSNALLMSLLEDQTVQGDQDHDEERLTTLIRDLQVELDHSPTTTHGDQMFLDNSHHHHLGSNINQEEYLYDHHFQPLDVGYVLNGGDCPAADSSGFGWIDIEMGSSTDADDTLNWYMDSCLDDDEMDCMSSFGGSSTDQEYYKGSTTTTSFEENGYQNLWQETCNVNTRMLA